MNDTCTYLIEICGHVEEPEINELSPLAVTVEGAAQGVTTVTACCDQAGLIGLLRHLHGLGFVFLAVTRVERGGAAALAP